MDTLSGLVKPFLPETKDDDRKYGMENGSRNPVMGKGRVDSKIRFL